MLQKAGIGIGVILLLLTGCANTKAWRQEDDKSAGVSYNFGAGKFPDGF